MFEYFIDRFPCNDVLCLWPPAVLEAAQKIPGGLKNRRDALNGLNKKVAVQQDEALTEEDWGF
ncbi:hypothetical protein FRC09_020076 [Ceratobasidium sp. 395]|nr:hypothetical protein FRC09_020076 [Ceratobasidium sp. 395]